MKLIQLIVVLCFSVNVFPGGGVDVGNGNSLVPFYTGDFNSEKELMAEVDLLKVKFENFKEARVASVYKNAKCTKSVNLHSVEKIDKYNIDGDRINYNKKFKGKINLIFQKCKKQKLLPDQIGIHY